MARTDNLKNFLTDIADSIREKKGTTEVIEANKFDTEIKNLPSGGGDEELEASYLSLLNDTLGANTIKLPNGLTSIGAHAFYTKTNLGAISLPDAITFIGRHAFTLCENMLLEKLPSSLTKIEEYAFAYCRKLALTNLPDTLTTIEQNAFRDCVKLALTELPSSLTVINDSTFYGCSSILLRYYQGSHLQWIHV